MKPTRARTVAYTRKNITPCPLSIVIWIWRVSSKPISDHSIDEPLDAQRRHQDEKQLRGRATERNAAKP